MGSRLVCGVRTGGLPWSWLGASGWTEGGIELVQGWESAGCRANLRLEAGEDQKEPQKLPRATTKRKEINMASNDTGRHGAPLYFPLKHHPHQGTLTFHGPKR